MGYQKTPQGSEFLSSDDLELGVDWKLENGIFKN